VDITGGWGTINVSTESRDKAAARRGMIPDTC
jgi:hypothetical protein